MGTQTFRPRHTLINVWIFILFKVLTVLYVWKILVDLIWFPDYRWYLTSFDMFNSYLYFLFACIGPLSIFYWTICLFLTHHRNYTNILNINHWSLITLQISSCTVCLFSLYGIFCQREVLHFNIVRFVNFFLMVGTFIFTFRPLIHMEFIFVYDMWLKANKFSFCMNKQFNHHHLLSGLFFPHWL